MKCSIPHLLSASALRQEQHPFHQQLRAVPGLRPCETPEGCAPDKKYPKTCSDADFREKSNKNPRSTPRAPCLARNSSNLSSS